MNGPDALVQTLRSFFRVRHVALAEGIRGGWSYGELIAPQDTMFRLYLQATTACLTAIVMMQIVSVLMCRSDRESVFASANWSNPLILIGIVTELCLILAIVYTHWGNQLFGTAPIGWAMRDGRFTLTALASQVSADGVNLASDYTFGDAQGFSRCCGGMTGDLRVDIGDFGFFSLACLQIPNFNAALDFHNDGRIDIADFGQFSVRCFRVLP